ncbi:MAG: protein kinase [Prevotella sp.]|nr:protein kinase [Prevotella sp.]
MELIKGALLQGGKYRIERALGQGGFGITYLAEQPMLERKVCIKEFFFKDYCEREESTSHVTLSTKSNKELVERFRRKFLKEARVISKLHHDHIVQIHDIFEENSTAYYVMDYVDGESLGDKIKREGTLSEPQALAYIKDAASALAYIHSKSINHLDIKPSNIMLRREDQRILLIDFGVSKRYDEETSEGTTTTPVGISHGYSPAEQYRRNGVQSFSPQSDVYSLAATLYKLLTGVTPPEAIEIQDEGLPLAPLRGKNVSESTITAIANAMKPRTQRTQSIGAFIADLDAPVEVTVVVDHAPQSTPEPTPEPIPEEKPKLDSEPSRAKQYIIAAIAVIVITVCGVIWYNSPNGKEEQVVTDYPIMANDGSVVYKWTGKLTSQNLPEGNGIAIFSSNDKYGRKEYRGDMHNGQMESENATVIYTNGSKYEGALKGGMRTEGILTLTNDEMYYKGTFKEGKEYNGKWYFLGSNDVYSEIVNGKEAIK